MANTSQSTTGLTAEEKRTLLQQLLRRRGQVSPLSYGQQALWFLAQMAPESAAYNCGIAIRVRSQVDIAALQRVLQAMVERHAALRTTFTTMGGEPIQHVRERGELHFRVEAASGWSDATLAERVDDEAHRPFDLERDPLLRALLFTRATCDHVLLLTFHHIIGDFMSFALLFDEFLTAWRAERAGKRSALPPAPAPYTDFVAWQTEMLRGPEGERHRAYWANRLSGDLPVLCLSDKPRPAVQTFDGAVHAFRLDEPLTRRLQDLARARGLTLYVILLAAFQVLLHRYSGEKDILVGTFAHGRARPEFARTLGYFVNSVVVRTSLDGDPAFVSLLGDVRQAVLEALEHQDYPFPLLVEQLGGAQSSSHSPLFQVAFNMLKPLPSEHAGFSLSALNPDVARLNPGAAHLDLDGLVLEPFPVRQRSVQFDLALTFDDAGDHLNGFLEYNMDLFDAASVERMADHLRILLQSIITHPEQRVREIPLLTEDEQTRALTGWNDTAAPYPEQQCLHHLFEQQARRTPHLVAAIYGDETLTYAELDAHANRLAHHLRALGVGPDVAVGICVDRSLDLVVALLGVLKAGGAYLPLDTDAPAIRLRQLLRNAQAPVCIAHDHVRARVEGDGVTVIPAGPWAALEQYPVTPPTVSVSADNLVSIYFTSGSTGEPKSVANTHRGWVNRMVWMQRRYGLAAGETMLQKTTLTFDDAAVEFFWPLSVGARVALMEPGLHRDPCAILDDAARYRAVVVQFVPSMLALVLDAYTPADRAMLGSLRHVISSGEALRPDLVRLFGERIGSAGVALHNQWGPTEASIDATAHTCGESDEAVAAVPIGRPIANTRVYILDTHLQPVPAGVAGDVYVAGVGLARGYLGDAARTAEAFMPNPFEPGAVMYRTGDRAHFRPDGSIVFLGRLDDQVKVRGQRVELAEIEATLAGHPAVKECAVAAFKGADGYRLAAYVALHSEDGGARGDLATALRRFLLERLPEYMVPGHVVHLERLPLTTSGKVDRKRLPDPGHGRPVLEQEYIAPSTPIEETIARVWQQVLGLSQIGVHDTFFELGGHSLDATRAVSRLNQELQVELSLREFFETPTVAGLAARVDGATSGSTAQQPIPRLPCQEFYAVSHAQQRLWFHYQFDRDHTYGTVLALELDGPLHGPAFEQTLRAFVARHDVLRTTFMERDGVPCQVVHDDMDLAYRYHDLSTLEEQEQAAALTDAVVTEAQASFDLATGPLFRAALLKLAAHRHRLLVSMHPIIFDGWSVTVLLEDLKALYETCKGDGLPLELPAPLQYADYAAWHNRRLDGGDFDGQKAYWLEHLAGYTGCPPLPRDVAIPPQRREPMTPRLRVIDSSLTARLRGLAQAHGVTLYMTLLAGLGMWIARVTGGTDVAVSSPVAGRTRAEMEGVFGMLWNPVTLRTDLSGNPSYLQALERARLAALGAYANQDYPFDLVVQELRRQSGADAELASVAFVLQNASTTALAFDDVGVQLTRSDFLLDGRDPVAELLGDAFDVPYDLHVEVFEAAEQMAIVTRYNPHRFQIATVDRFLDQIVSVLEQVTSDPRVRLSQLEVRDLFDYDDLFAADEMEAV